MFNSVSSSPHHSVSWFSQSSTEKKMSQCVSNEEIRKPDEVSTALLEQVYLGFIFVPNEAVMSLVMTS